MVCSQIPQARNINPCLNAGNHEDVILQSKREIKVADGIKIANALILK